jgi:phage-related protein
VASTIRISILADAANAIRGLRNTGQGADGASARLAVLQRRVDAVNGKKVDVSVSTHGFTETVAAIVTADLVLDRFRKGMPDLSLGLTRVADKLALIAAGALAATAAMLPLAAATLAVGAAVGAAVLGIGLFAAIAVPTLQTVTKAVQQYNTASLAYDQAKAIGDTKAMASAQQKMAGILGALTPLQRGVAEQVIGMNQAWNALSASQAPIVLAIISNAVGTLRSILPKLTPAITAVDDAIRGISSSAFAGLAKAVTPIVNLITSQGVPALKSLAAIVFNLLPVVLNLVTAFAPLGNTILSRLAPLSAALRGFNFDGLAKSATTLLPLVGTLLGNLGGALANLVKAAAPLAGPVLAGLGAIAGTLKTAFGGPEIKVFVANIAKIVPAVAPIVAVLVPAFLKFADIISGQLVVLVPQLLPIVKQLASVFVNVLTGLSPLLPALLGLIGVVASFLPVLYPLIVAFRDAMIPVVNAVSGALVALRPSFALIVAALKTLLAPIAKLLTSIVPLVPLLIGALVPAFIVVTGAVGQFLTMLTPLLPALTPIIAALVTGLTPVLAALGAVMPQVVAAVGQLVPPLLGIAVALLPILPPISQLATALIGALVPAAVALVPPLTDIANVIAQALPGAIRILLPVFSTLTGFVKDPAFLLLAGTIGGIVLAVKAWGVAQNIANGVIKAAAEVQRLYTLAVNSTILANARAAIGFIAEKVALVASSIATGVATAAQWLLNIALDANPVGLIILAIAALVAAFVLAYQHSDTFRKIVQGALHAVAAAFVFLWDGAKAVFGWLVDHWKLVLSIITGPIGAIIGFVVSHWDTIRATIVNGFNAVVNFFSSIPGKFLAAGQAIMQGLVNGIDAGLNWVRDKVRGLGNLIPDWLKSVLGISSPSKVMADVGTNILTGLASGITAKLPHLKRTLSGIGDVISNGLAVTPTTDLSGLATGVTASIKTGVAAASVNPGTLAVTAATTPAAMPGITININVAPGADPAEAGRQAVAAIEAYQRRTGRRWLVAGPTVGATA